MKSLKKISAVALLSAAIIGAPAFQGCQKQVIDVNTNLPEESEEVVIPKTDLTKVEQLLQSIVDKINADQKKQLETLIETLSNGNKELKDKLTEIIAEIEKVKENQKTTQDKLDATSQELKEIKAKLQDVVDAINALNNGLVQKIQDAVKTIIENNTQDIVSAINIAKDALVKADSTSADAIIKALQSHHLEIKDLLAKAVEKLDNKVLNEKMDALLILLADNNADQKVIIEKLKAVLEQMAYLVNKSQEVEANVGYAENLPFVDPSEVPVEKPYEDLDPAILTEESFADHQFYATATFNEASVGSVMFTDEQKKALLDAVTSNLKIKSLTKVAELDSLSAIAQLKTKINELPEIWDNANLKVYEVSMTYSDEITSAELVSATQNVIGVEKGVSVYATVNNMVYYVIGTCMVAEKIDQPQFVVKTNKGQTTHGGTPHSPHGDSSNAGGGILGK